MRKKIVANKNILPIKLLDVIKVQEGLLKIRENAKQIKINSADSITWSQEFPPSDTVIDCFINAVNQLNSYINKDWNTPEEFIKDIMELYSLVIQYKKTDLSWIYNFFNLGGATIGRVKRLLYLYNLYYCLQNKTTKEEAMKLGVKTFYRMLKYQAQLDGNTRVASLVSNLVFLRNGLEPFILSDENAATFYKLTSDIKYGNFFVNYNSRILELFFTGVKE